MMTPTQYSQAAFESAYEYIDQVIRKKVRCGKLERLAVERHLCDLNDQERMGLFFDAEEVDRVFRFFSLLKHSKGREWAGKQFVLSGWQAFIILVVFGWYRRTDRLRRYRWCYIQIGRKNGKSTFAGGIALYMLTADKEPGAEVYSAATKRDQAKIVFDVAKAMVRKSPKLDERLSIFKNNISDHTSGSKFEPLGADADTLDGLDVYCGVIDELHAHKSRKAFDVIETGTGARLQPLIFIITTAGAEVESICAEQRDYAGKILEGTLDDDAYFAFICEPDKEDNWKDERNWRKGNPNLGSGKKIEGIREKFKKAAAAPAAQNSFRRLELDEWTSVNERWMDMEIWNACKIAQVALERRRAFGGLDLSAVTDLTAYVLAFEPDQDGSIPVLPFIWMPEDVVEEREKKDNAPYSQWIEDGFIMKTPGNVVDYGFIESTILETDRLYRVVEIGYDPWNALQTAVRLEGEGITMVEHRQGFKSMSPAMKETMRIVKSRSLNHMNNPVLKWCVSNVQARMDPAENIKPDKAASKKRIDPIVALIMAIGRLTADNEQHFDASRGIIAV